MCNAAAEPVNFAAGAPDDPAKKMVTNQRCYPSAVLKAAAEAVGPLELRLLQAAAEGHLPLTSWPAEAPQPLKQP